MARLPNGRNAVVEKGKVTDYLLSETHPAGRSKAAYFRRFGFDAAAWEVLRDALLDQAGNSETTNVTETIFGTKYTIEADIAAPDGRRPRVRSVWFVSTGESVPRLVTVIPLRGGDE